MVKPYLMFSGNCAEAIEHYRRSFSGEITRIQRYGDMPPNPAFPVTNEMKNRILHVELKLANGGTILGCDSFMAESGKGPVGISVEMDSEEKAREAWNLLKEGGSVRMEMGPQFFARLHGSLVDKFGVTWLFTVE